MHFIVTDQAAILNNYYLYYVNQKEAEGVFSKPSLPQPPHQIGLQSEKVCIYAYVNHKEADGVGR